MGTLSVFPKLFGLLVLGTMICGAANAQSYIVRALPLPGGVTGTCVPTCINNLGVAVGYATSGTGSVGVKWLISNPGTITGSTLPLLAGYANAFAYGINDDGVIVGHAKRNSGYPTDRAFVINTSNTITALNQIASDSDGYIGMPVRAYSIDNAGNITGELDRFGQSGLHAIVFPPLCYKTTATGTPTEIRPVYAPGTNQMGLGAIGFHISGGVMTGYANYWDANLDNALEGFLSSTSPAVTWGYVTSPGYISCGLGNNSSGEVVGYGQTSAGNQVLYRSSGGVCSILTTLGGQGQSINNYSKFVGWMNVSSGTQVGFVSGPSNSLLDLNSYIPTSSGWTIANAISINDNGWILASGSYNGVSTACVLIPQ